MWPLLMSQELFFYVLSHVPLFHRSRPPAYSFTALLFAERTLHSEAMKRARVSDGPRNTVRLNVAGKLFQTSRETLSASVFFASLLKFDGDGDLDADGNIFVDRDPKLFQVILNSLRTARRPNQRIINLWKFELLEECRFFGTDEVAARIMGRTHVQKSTVVTSFVATCSVVFCFGPSRNT